MPQKIFNQWFAEFWRDMSCGIIRRKAAVREAYDYTCGLGCLHVCCRPRGDAIPVGEWAHCGLRQCYAATDNVVIKYYRNFFPGDGSAGGEVVVAYAAYDALPCRPLDSGEVPCGYIRIVKYRRLVCVAG